MLELKEISVASIPMNLHMHGAIHSQTMIEMNTLIKDHKFASLDALIRSSVNISMRYHNAQVWSDITGETSVTLKLKGIADIPKEISHCKTIW